MSVNMRSAAQVGPKVVYSNYVPTTGAPMYQPATDDGAQIKSFSLHNQDTVNRDVTIGLVRSGATAGASNQRVITMTPGQIIDRPEMMLGGGDFIWASASAANKIDLQITAIEYSNSVGTVASGIRIDATGTGGHGLSGSVSACTNKIGTLPNRRLVSSLMVQETGASAGWASYTGGGPTISCSDGPMTRKASVDFNNGAAVQGSAHIFTYDNPTSGSTQSIVPAAAASGATMNLVVGSRCYSGVDLTAGLGAVTTGPVGAAVLSLPYTMGAGDVPIMAGAFFAPPQALNMNFIDFDGITSGFTVPIWLAMCDIFGLSALTAIVSNSTQHCAAGIVLKAA